MPDIAPEDYCGPGAFAAVTGTPRSAAHRALAFWRDRAGWQPGPQTSPMAMAAALMMRGYRLERWSIVRGGWREETADEFARYVWGEIRRERERWDEIQRLVENHIRCCREPKPAPVEARLKEVREIWRARWKRTEPSVYTVSDWLHRRRVGTWVLRVPGHVMAARDGELITGDQGYDNTPLLEAWRVRRI